MLYVGNIPFHCDEEAVRETFSRCGEVLSVRIARHPVSKRSLGFAFVEMKDGEASERACRELHLCELDGRAIRVAEMRPRDDRARV